MKETPIIFSTLFNLFSRELYSVDFGNLKTWQRLVVIDLISDLFCKKILSLKKLLEKVA